MVSAPRGSRSLVGICSSTSDGLSVQFLVSIGPVQEANLGPLWLLPPFPPPLLLDAGGPWRIFYIDLLDADLPLSDASPPLSIAQLVYEKLLQLLGAGE